MSEVEQHQNDDVKTWIDRYDRLQTRQSDQIDTLTRDVSALTADVRALMRNQEALFTKSSRPFQWGAFVSALALVALGAGLLVAPLDRENIRQNSVLDTLETEFHHYVQQSEYKHGRQDESLEWLKKLEARQNSRLHDRYGMDG